MRPPSRPPKAVNVTYLEGSAHPLAYRVVRSDPRRVTIGTNDVDITVGKDKPPDSRPLALPEEWAVAADLAEANVPVHFEPLRHLPNGATTYTIKRPQLTVDAGSGVIRGTAVLSIPDSSAPDYLASPLEIPVQITIKVPRSADDLKAPLAHVRACKLACVDTTVDISYNRDLLARLIRDAAKAAKDAKQTGVTVNQLAQVVLDIEELVKDIVTRSAADLVKLQFSTRGPLTRIRATVDPVRGTTDYRWLGFNLIPKGLLDVAAPGWGVRGNRILGQRVPYTAALLAYPSLPAIFAGEHWTSMFPAYVYGEVSHARKVTRGLELGVRLTVALDIWERLGLEPGVAPPQLFAPLPAGADSRNVPAGYRSERGRALQEIKDNLSAGQKIQPWIIFRVEGKW